MILTRTPSPLRPSRLNTAIALLLVFISLVRGFPLNGQQLDSAVEGVQKYLESSGFPKMTRGEVLDFLNDFSKNSRVSRSDNNALNVKKDITSYVTPQPDFEYSKTQMPNIHNDATENKTHAPKIPNGESPLNYGYPMSLNKQTDQPPPSSTPTIFVTVQDGNLTSDKRTEIMLQAMQGRNAQKKNIGPSVDLNAYTKFKKIPEARNLKIDDDMKDFLNNFGLLDTPKSGKSIDLKPNEPLRRNDDAAVTETVDEKLLKSILAETGNSGVNISDFQPLLESASTSRDHVFNPSDSNVKTVDINRIAKIVANIRLLTDDNNTVSLSQDAIQKKLENITEAISAIDQPTDNNSAFNGYEVFFDDNSKEVDSDLPASQFVPETQTLTKAQNPPDPLSTDELQMLLEKNKNDVKRQQPANDTSVANISTSTEEPIPVATSSETVVTSVVTDSSSEATSIEVTSGASAPRDSSTVADTNPSLSQLAESFGGGETASNPPPAIDELINTPSPERPKNGLYFYVDWNSFLTVNGGQKNQVNLRFAPKAGNPNHFIKVNVP